MAGRSPGWKRGGGGGLQQPHNTPPHQLSPSQGSASAGHVDERPVDDMGPAQFANTFFHRYPEQSEFISRAHLRHSTERRQPQQLQQQQQTQRQPSARRASTTTKPTWNQPARSCAGVSQEPQHHSFESYDPDAAVAGNDSWPDALPQLQQQHLQRHQPQQQQHGTSQKPQSAARQQVAVSSIQKPHRDIAARVTPSQYSAPHVSQGPEWTARQRAMERILETSLTAEDRSVKPAEPKIDVTPLVQLHHVRREMATQTWDDQNTVAAEPVKADGNGWKPRSHRRNQTEEQPAIRIHRHEIKSLASASPADSLKSATAAPATTAAAPVPDSPLQSLLHKIQQYKMRMETEGDGVAQEHSTQSMRSQGQSRSQSQQQSHANDSNINFETAQQPDSHAPWRLTQSLPSRQPLTQHSQRPPPRRRRRQPRQLDNEWASVILSESATSGAESGAEDTRSDTTGASWVQQPESHVFQLVYHSQTPSTDQREQQDSSRRQRQASSPSRTPTPTPPLPPPTPTPTPAAADKGSTSEATPAAETGPHDVLLGHFSDWSPESLWEGFSLTLELPLLDRDFKDLPAVDASRLETHETRSPAAEDKNEAATPQAAPSLLPQPSTSSATQELRALLVNYQAYSSGGIASSSSAAVEHPTAAAASHQQGKQAIETAAAPLALPPSDPAAVAALEMARLHQQLQLLDDAIQRVVVPVNGSQGDSRRSSASAHSSNEFERLQQQLHVLEGALSHSIHGAPSDLALSGLLPPQQPQQPQQTQPALFSESSQVLLLDHQQLDQALQAEKATLRALQEEERRLAEQLAQEEVDARRQEQERMKSLLSDASVVEPPLTDEQQLLALKSQLLPHLRKLLQKEGAAADSEGDDTKHRRHQPAPISSSSPNKTSSAITTATAASPCGPVRRSRSTTTTALTSSSPSSQKATSPPSRSQLTISSPGKPFVEGPLQAAFAQRMKRVVERDSKRRERQHLLSEFMK